MRRHLTTSEIRGALKTRGELSGEGMTDARLQRMVREGALKRVQRNRYVSPHLHDEAWPESQHKIAVVAAAEEMRGGAAVVSYGSAAVMHGLPLYRYRPAKVEVTIAHGSHPSGSDGIRRHDEPLEDSDLVEIDGVLCTSLERTVFDLSRTLAWEQAVACADAAMRSATVRDRVVDIAAADRWRARMDERVARAAGMRGIRQARRMVGFADGRAELPGESVSRVQLVRLGFTDLDLQVRVPSPSGRDYEIDIAILRARSFWEFDGTGKYLDPSLRAGRTAEQVVLDEKRREDWIRGKTQWRFCRGEDAHIATPAAMATRLSLFGISPP